MCCGEFCRQFGVLAWKNAKLKLRSPVSLILEIVVPTVIIIVLGALSKGLYRSTTQAYIPALYSPNLPFNYFYGIQCDDNLVYICSPCSSSSKKSCQSRRIGVAPYDNGNSAAKLAAQEFVAFANAYTGNTSFVYFASEQDFLSVIGNSLYSVDDSYQLYSSAVIFNDGFPQWDYILRLNRTFNSYKEFIPSTAIPVLDLSIKGPQDSTNIHKYLDSGYFALNDLVTSFVASSTCQKTPGKCTSKQFVKARMNGVADFPNGKYINAGFWANVGFIFGLLMIIAFCLPIANVIVYLVQEKESKMRESMYMMAMRSDVLWLSWIFHFMCLFLPLSILLSIAGVLLFEYSSGIYVFFYFITFFMASISYCIFISTLFNKARSAAVAGCLLFFAGYIIYIGVNFGTTIERSTVLGASIHPAAAFCFAALSFQNYEDSNIGITSYTWNKQGDTVPVSFQDTLNMLFIDIFIYAVLAWYFSNTFPSEYGTHKPWYFPLLPSYWFSCCSSFADYCGFSTVHTYDNVNRQSVGDADVEMATLSEAPVEEVSQALKDQVGSKMCIDIQGLVKEFPTATGPKRAVDNLNLTMYSGEITALLGHNGAGKTTTIAMLTGLIPVDSGSAVIEGHDVGREIDTIRKNLGVCPQHDILYPLLTVEEHLILFARFKGVPNSQLQQEVESMIQIVGLTEKRKEYSKSLSGGQKRKLSVGIAFIGGSRVVLLDEPTSGMDPYSRRFTWNLIRQQKKGRIVVLTTHFMDEADLLGDRVAIMGDGKLRCCGSSLYLKTKFGLGYSMTIEKEDPVAFNSQAVSDVVLSRIPEARLLNDVGKEIAFQLPFSSSSLFQDMFKFVDDNLANLHIGSYGVSVTTLEEVFITIQNATETQAHAEAGRMKLQEETEEHAIAPAEVVAVPHDDLEATAEPTKINESDYLSYFGKHLFALFTKRFLYFLRDWKSWLFLYFIPFLFLLCGLLVMYLTKSKSTLPLLKLDKRIYNPDISNNYMPTPYSDSNQFCLPTYNPSLKKLGPQKCNGVNGQSSIMNAIPNSGKCPMIANTTANSIYGMSAFLYSGREKYAAAQFGAVSFLNSSFLNRNGTIDSVTYVIHANYTGVHASPLFAAIFSAGLTRSINPSASVTVSMHPLPRTQKENVISSNFNVTILSLFLLIAIAVAPASFATHIVREREVKAKHQQIVSGVSYPVYWLSNWLWDFVSYIPLGIIFVILIASFPNTESLSGIQQSQLAAFIVLLLSFGFAITSFTYLISFLFKTPSGAQIACILFNFIIGVGLSSVGFALRLSSSTQDVYLTKLRYIFCLLPAFALGDGLYNLGLRDFYTLLELGSGKKYGTFDWKITGANICFMLWTSVVYMGLCILLEYLMMNESFQRYFKVNLPPEGPNVRDQDVLDEEARVNALDETNSPEKTSVLIKNFKHMYSNGKFAVKGLSLGIPNGECFGLLGINGAGKSTTLSMLSGEFIPTTGEVYLAGTDLLREAQICRRKIGFCPQFDSILELLSAREHLKLYARIKGIVESDIDRVVNAKIAEMGLTEYADRAAGTYSGGNKRKLSVAIAMIGEPSIVFLDEPSTGMDPVARRFMWRVISDIVTKREKCSLILTTHSMEECEALCTRIGIMVGGVLRCLGSGQRLRSNYGHGYQIEVGLVIITPEQIEERATQLFPTFGNLGVPSIHAEVNRVLIHQAFEVLGLTAWEPLLFNDTNIMVSQDANITLTSLSSWLLLEEKVDRLYGFFQNNFGAFQVKERQISKVRVEISVTMEDGVSRRSLSTLFGLIERNKEVLGIRDYSISQTSLEQIFNQFAAQQEEETGAAAGLLVGGSPFAASVGAPAAAQSSTYAPVYTTSVAASASKF